MRAYGLSPMTTADAWALYNGIRADRRVGFAPEPPDLETTWKQLSTRDSASPKLWMDSYLAAFALAAGHLLVTTDKAFKQCRGLDAVIL